MPFTALLLRARIVRGAPVFCARELGHRAGARTYALRATGMHVVIRHGTGDVVTLGEVFHEQDYAIPSRVSAALGVPERILDLGANIGLFGIFAAERWPRAQIQAYEPDPANAAVHRQVIAANAMQEQWRLVQAAAGAADGEARFVSGQVALSSLDAGGDIAVPVCDVLHAIADADLVKMDIEGGEWPILTDPRFAASPPSVIVLEYHPQGCHGPDPHASIAELLAGAGLQTIEIWRRDDGYGMLWAWRA